MLEPNEFIKEYNKLCDWDNEFLKGFTPNYTSGFINRFFHTTKITEEEYDLKSAKVYEYDDGLLELQIFSTKTLGTSYFWLRMDRMKDYKETMLELALREINVRSDELTSEINMLESKKEEYRQLREKLTP